MAENDAVDLPPEAPAKKPRRKPAPPKEAGGIPIVYRGPEGFVGLNKNDRTGSWEAMCKPEGTTRHVTITLAAKSEEDAKSEAIFALKHDSQHRIHRRPTREDAMEAVKTLIAYSGDNPYREGLRGTPDRVIRAYDEFFAGYHSTAAEVLKTTFAETGSYDEMVTLTDIEFDSHCEHHMVPFTGVVHIAYIPDKTVVGISKLARLVEIYARRLQIQEKMTTQIADKLHMALKPKGVAVVIAGQHMCMTTRGVKKKRVKMITSTMTGVFREDPKVRSEFMNLIGNPKGGMEK
ncbi:GTP cyclohydrolase I FolE [Paramagnetospirillum magneticum]|uniref:GTP cyclohydrolase 1 n=1 Tax=Paramagnetospirillum magneticum (strain ATCC 700264 / AMB-1) TaxID=342108 RepID=Q2W0Y5_PARM1|nr:GTP cyclohydrolase I FolE [Paramagnetospirillum magneticum]BAE52490.1 GTP cyclohydrolase I [Paramagnetospirillum magneticum AMB-1]